MADDARKFYVVFDGRYSDIYVVGVFSTSEAAEAIKAQYRDGHIEEFALDELVGRKVPRFCCVMDLGTGEISRPTEWAAETPLAPGERSKVEPYYQGGIRAYSVESIDHAMKVAVEYRQKYLRERGQVHASEGPHGG